MSPYPSRGTLFLYASLYALDSLLFPRRMSRIGESFEAWACRNGLLRQIQRLENHALLERDRTGRHIQALRLTDKARSSALLVLDPKVEWDRPWEGSWHLVMFDITEPHASDRRKLRQALQTLKFGLLQRSVWVSTRPPPKITRWEDSIRHPHDAHAFVHWTGSPASGLNDQEIARQAWDWERIAKLYTNYLKHLRSPPAYDQPPESWQAWLAQEHALWRQALAADPLLPTILHPKTYPGPSVREERMRQFARIASKTRQKTARSSSFLSCEDVDGRKSAG